MNARIKFIVGLTVIILIIVSGLIMNQKQSDEKPPWVHQVHWSERPDEAAKIEEHLWTEISPYRTEYETVNITASAEGKGWRLKVIAFSKDSDRVDIYDFVYEEEELLLTGYLLEAIPFQYRNEAVGIALGNQELSASVSGAAAPTVRRILPRTSEKFYAPKTLLSVTWEGVSALIDPEEGKTVQIWRSNAQGDQAI